MPTPLTPVTILVVDDDPGISRLIVRELNRNGHHAVSVSSGEQAITWLNENVAHLVLLDLKLPGLRGNELIEHLDSFHDHLPFIIITGQGDERVAVDMMKRGALDYVIKDANFITLVPTVVQRALARIEEQTRLSAAEKALARSNAELEHRVIERTTELTQANQALRESRVAALNLMDEAIAARKKAEQAEAALCESEARYRGFFENVGVGTVEVDADGRFTRVNDRFCSITGYSREELVGGMSPRDLTHPDDAESNRERVEQVLHGELPIYETERRCIRKDGAMIWVSGTPQPFTMTTAPFAASWVLPRTSPHANRLSRLCSRARSGCAFSSGTPPPPW